MRIGAFLFEIARLRESIELRHQSSELVISMAKSIVIYTGERAAEKPRPHTDLTMPDDRVDANVASNERRPEVLEPFDVAVAISGKLLNINETKNTMSSHSNFRIVWKIAKTVLKTSGAIWRM